MIWTSAGCRLGYIGNRGDFRNPALAINWQTITNSRMRLNSPAPAVTSVSTTYFLAGLLIFGGGVEYPDAMGPTAFKIELDGNDLPIRVSPPAEQPGPRLAINMGCGLPPNQRH